MAKTYALSDADARTLRESLSKTVSNVAVGSNTGGNIGGGYQWVGPQIQTYPPFTDTTKWLSETLAEVESEASPTLFDQVRSLLEDLAESREFTDELYDRWLSVKMLLTDLEAEMSLAQERVDLIGGLLHDWRATAESVGTELGGEPSVDGELSEELALSEAGEGSEAVA